MLRQLVFALLLPPPLSSPQAAGSVAVSCYLRGGTHPVACCKTGRTCTPFDTFVLDRQTMGFTRHPHLNCWPASTGHPSAGSQWGTGDLARETHRNFTVSACEAACMGDKRCDAITVGPPGGVPPLSPSPPNAFAWIRAIESGPPGRRYMLEATTYLIDRQYQLPPGTELIGAGSEHYGEGTGNAVTVIKGVGPRYSSTCGAHAKNRKGLLLGDHTYVARLHFIGTDTGRYKLDPPNNDLCGGAPIETPGCAGGNGYAAPPTSCGGIYTIMHTTSTTCFEHDRPKSELLDICQPCMKRVAISV